MTIQAIREYVHRLWDQYQVAGRRTRSRILDELVRNLEIHRKSANRLMRASSLPALGRSKGGRKKRYDEACIDLLRMVWREMGYCSSKHLRSGLREWLPYFDKVDIQLKELILQMASSTMDIHLKKDKANLRRKLNTGTRSVKNRHLTSVPLRDWVKKPDGIGHMQVDMVAHCGESMSGRFAWTLTVTCMVSGWTENETMMGKDGYTVKKALERIEDLLPFKIKSLNFDNGTEFMNDDVINKFAKRKNREEEIPVFRSRPYKKNDQCYVEQKNFTHVREVFGYDRIDWNKGPDMMNGVYRGERRLLSNFFLPQMKLKEKWREGSQIKKRYLPPKTPFQMVIEATDVSDEIKLSLQTQKSGLNPRDLRRKMRKKMSQFWGYLGRKDHQLTKQAI